VRNGKVVLPILILVLVIVAVGYGIGWSKCEWYGYQTERNVRFSGSIGCMVKTSNGWAPRSEMRSELD
jgi:hypothetical protein